MDIRSRSQRRLMGLFEFREESIPLEHAGDLEPVVERAKKEGRPLYIYDMAGKQVRWLQYYLVEKGLKDYYFMQDGYRGFLEAKRASRQN